MKILKSATVLNADGTTSKLKAELKSYISGLPVGAVIWHSGARIPGGFLICNGAAVSRIAFPDLFSSIGTTYGEGDGETTFNLPNLLGRVAQGASEAGQYLEAGLPNIEGGHNVVMYSVAQNATGAFSKEGDATGNLFTSDGNGIGGSYVHFYASLSNPIYGNSDTVQPPALTLIPCIKAFDDIINSGVVDVTSLANDVIIRTTAAEAAHAAMPSDSRIVLTVGSSYSTYTAPSDGYFAASGVCTALPSFISLYDVPENFENKIISHSYSTTVGYGVSTCIACKQGMTVGIEYTNVSPVGLIFIYAEGSKP